MEGLEPPRLSALEPKSSVSTNFTTSADKICPSQTKNLKGFQVKSLKTAGISSIISGATNPAPLRSPASP